MFQKPHFLVGLAAAVASLLCFALAEAKKPDRPPGGGGGNPGRTSYTIVKLDDANGRWVDCYAHDINHLGDVVGQVEDPDTSEQRAAYWEVSRSGGSIESQLSTLTGGSRADGINDAGEIVGYGIDSDGHAVGLYWAHAAAAPLLLPRLNENMYSCASAINNDGVVCGHSDDQAVAWRITWADGEASVWGPVALPTLDVSIGLAINNNDVDGFAQIVGYVGQPTAAVAWTVQSWPDGTLSVDPVPRIVEVDDAMALGVNDSGMISGQAGWPREARVWIEVSSQILHRGKKITSASAQDINNNGTIVGWGGRSQYGPEAVVWPSAAGKMILLNKYIRPKSPFLKLIEARAVNEIGEVVGFGLAKPYPGTGRVAFLAIPE